MILLSHGQGHVTRQIKWTYVPKHYQVCGHYQYSFFFVKGLQPTVNQEPNCPADVSTGFTNFRVGMEPRVCGETTYSAREL